MFLLRIISQLRHTSLMLMWNYKMHCHRGGKNGFLPREKIAALKCSASCRPLASAQAELLSIPASPIWNSRKQEDVMSSSLTFTLSFYSAVQIISWCLEVLGFLWGGFCLFLTLGSGLAPLSRLPYLWFLIKAVTSMGLLCSQYTNTSHGPLVS